MVMSAMVPCAESAWGFCRVIVPVAFTGVEEPVNLPRNLGYSRVELRFAWHWSEGDAALGQKRTSAGTL